MKGVRRIRRSEKADEGRGDSELLWIRAFGLLQRMQDVISTVRQDAMVRR